MAKVSLRAYIHDIEALIDRGNTDEAIAHCRHILRTFPKHLDTYRILGKANLESKRYTEAADVFKRILLAVPDDFVSHVGMSIIHDSQKNLDETIWHMERAFEVQPSNAAVQAELQRLYGQRDGREPHKIRLTRGALAHMYVQGELYPQAISEIRAVLSEDPSRTDMLALLANAYFRAGQKAEASDTCSQLLNRFPYCLDANRILVEILPGTGMADTIATYRNRVTELDPYAPYSPGSIFQTEEAPDNSVTLDRLDYSGQPVAQGSWQGSLGGDMNQIQTPAARPDWLRAPTEEQPAPPPSTPEPVSSAPAPASGGEQIPDWMREQGWGESSGTFDEAAFSQQAEEPVASSELAKADLPDWIKSMAPPAQEPAAPAAESEEDTMDWLNKLTAASAGAAAASGSSDLFANLGSESQQEKEPSATLPDWITEPEPEPAKPSSAPVPAPVQEKPATPAPAAPVEEKPAAPAPASGIGELGTSAADQDAAMLWLESLAAKQGAKAEELITNPNERLEKPPEWVEQARAIAEEQPAQEIPAAPAEQPSWPSVEDTGVFESSSALDQTSAWLRNLEAEEEKPVEQPAPAESAAASSVEETSTWLKNLEKEEEIPSAAEPSPAESVVEPEIPSWLQSLESEESAKQAEPAAPEGDELPSWLKEQPPMPKPPEPTHPAEWVPEAAAQKPATPETPKPETPKPEPSKVEPAKREAPVAKPIQAEAPKAKPAPAKPAPVKPAAAPKPAPRPKETRKPEVAPAAPVAVERTRTARAGGILPPMTEPALDQARELMSAAKIPDALQEYGALIRKGKMLEEITFDLKEALYRFPVEVSIWQTLGDAYMRANRLQDALDAYTKAEELLR